MVIWRIVDGKAGHDSQSRGLASALLKTSPGVCHDIPAMTAGQAIIHYLFGNFPPGNGLQKPVFIIGAGHGTHMSMLCAQRAYGGKSVVLMKPGLPASWFDYCLVPDHDRPEQRENIIVTRGALNPVVPSTNHDRNKGLIMIGGPSKHYAWDNDSIMNQLKDITGTGQDIYWTVTDSQRTPAITRTTLQALVVKNAGYYPHDETGRGWIAERLAEAGSVWVTADSVSMIYEALTSGAWTGILSVPKRLSDKITGIINTLADEGLVTTYNDWKHGNISPLKKQYLNEAERCARKLLAEILP